MSGLGTVILVIHTLVAMAMIGVILLQRSEGGALGMGGGSNSFLSARSAGNVLTRTTTILVVIFFLSSMALTVLGQRGGPKSLQFGTPTNGKVVAPQAVPVPAAPKPAAPSAPANPINNLPGFGAEKPGSTENAPSTGEIQPPTSLEPAKPAAPSSGEIQAPVSLEPAKPAAPSTGIPGPASGNPPKTP